MNDPAGDSRASAELAMNLMRLSFPSGREEQIAIELVQFLASRRGSQIAGLNPDTTMEEALDMAGAGTWTTAELSRVLDLGDFKALDDEFAHMTLREFVHCAATRTP